jgi:hypothetical protein
LFLIGRYLKIFYSKTAWPNGPKHGRKHLWKVLYGKCSFRFDPFWSISKTSGFRGEDLKKSANQKQELPVAAMFVNGLGRNEHFYRGPSIDASYQV